jgi:hypothetical protein
MKESLLHFIWQFQKFSKSDLKTVKGEKLEILFPGYPNSLAGPDFSQAKIYLDNLYWAGPVELHVHSSDWFRHGHQTDLAYDNVILHVVWDFDSDVSYPNGQSIPTFDLSKYVAASTLENYHNKFSPKPKFISCERQIKSFSKARWLRYQERLFVERMEDRVGFIQNLLKKLKNDWEATLFVLLSKGFGLNINGKAFFDMACSIPFKRVLQLRNDSLNLEAVFMGQSGLLNHPLKGAYQEDLRTRYHYIKSKFKLQIPHGIKVHFARLRPANFPTLRLSQLAQLYSKSGALFEDIVGQQSPQNCYALFDVKASDYWNSHYNFDSKSQSHSKKISRRFLDLLLTNTLIPIRFTYAKYKGSSGEDSLFEWAAVVPSENNRILSRFKSFEVPQVNAISSQSILHLYKKYCKLKKCLSCQVGFELMKYK